MGRRRQLSWDDIEKQAKKKHGVRTKRPRRRLITLLVLVLAVSIGVVAAGVAGQGPYTSLARRIGLGGPPSTEFELDGRHYRTGDCVIWNPNEEGGRFHTTKIVRCDEDHLIEIAGIVDAQGASDKVPTEWEMRAIVKRECLAVTEAYAGGKLDPEGRYYVSALTPTTEGWRAGDRTLWCGLEANWKAPDHMQQANPDQPTAFRGDARAANQFWTYEAGDCLPPDSPVAVPCSREHDREVVGMITLPADTVLPTAKEAWDDLVRDGCAARLRSYVGRALDDTWRLDWDVVMSPESWAAGDHSVTCIISKWEGSDLLTLTGSVRSQNA